MINAHVLLCRIVAVGDRARQCYVQDTAGVNKFDNLVPQGHNVSLAHMQSSLICSIFIVCSYVIRHYMHSYFQKILYYTCTVSVQ